MRSFQSALSGGHRAERAWVDNLRSLGRSVAHGKKIVVRNHCKVADHVDTPDSLALLSIEIKERSISFHGPEDYPYPTVFVDDARGLSREGIRHFAYVYVSRPTGKWVWLSPLDRDSSWTVQEVFDRGRGHPFQMLVCPKQHLRPAEQLINLIYPHLYLDLVDGNTTAFVSGGGEAEERDRYVAKTHPDAGGRGATPAGPTRERMG